MLTLTRTANAGVLLGMDGKRILLDGVCRAVYPYPATPSHVRENLTRDFPDLVAVTHCHEDHCDPAFEELYTMSTGRTVIDPTGVRETTCGNLRLRAVPSRHLGKVEIAHHSYILEGQSCVWFLGDAAPLQWRGRTDLPKPDVVIAPFAYATTAFAWELTQSLGAKKIVLVHLPEKAQDPYHLWSAISETVGENGDVFIPEMEEFIEIAF